MSTNLSEVLSVLSEAHSAVQIVPELRTKIADLEFIGKGNADRINAQEQTLAARDYTIGELQARIHALEVARDQATFREAEANDKFTHAMHTLDAIMGRARDFKQALEPEPVPVQHETVSNVEVDPSERATSSPLPVTSPLPVSQSTLGATPAIDTTPPDGSGDSIRPTMPSPAPSGGGSTQNDTSHVEVSSSPLSSSPAGSTSATASSTSSSTETTSKPIRELNSDDFYAGRADRSYDFAEHKWIYTPKTANVA